LSLYKKFFLKYSSKWAVSAIVHSTHNYFLQVLQSKSHKPLLVERRLLFWNTNRKCWVCTNFATTVVCLVSWWWFGLSCRQLNMIWVFSVQWGYVCLTYDIDDYWLFSEFFLWNTRRYWGIKVLQAQDVVRRIFNVSQNKSLVLFLKKLFKQLNTSGFLHILTNGFPGL